jgi:acylphosphatase
MAEALHLIVHGRVQGVAFRLNTEREARALGLAGWVRNLPDGSVEVWASGERVALDALRDWCNHGPRLAVVERVTESRPAIVPELPFPFRQDRR